MIKKYSVKINGHQTSISLEKEFWEELNSIAQKKNQSMNSLISSIDENKNINTNLSSAIRVYILSALKESLATI